MVKREKYGVRSRNTEGGGSRGATLDIDNDENESCMKKNREN